MWKRSMKKFLTYLLTFLGLTAACGQRNYENADVKQFAELIGGENVVVLDVRTAEEYADGHLAGALNIDVNADGFVQAAKEALPTEKTIAVYCRGGRRSVKACELLDAEGFQTVNLKGGYMAWEEEGMPTTKE